MYFMVYTFLERWSVEEDSGNQNSRMPVPEIDIGRSQFSDQFTEIGAVSAPQAAHCPKR
jgi:hypothetical protein